MRLNNRNKAGLYSFINTFLLILVILGVCGFLLERFRFKLLGWETYLLIFIPLLMLISFYLAGRQIFEYDSDGEALNFKNRNVLSFLDRPASDEFPKYKLIKYEIVDFLWYKRLFVTISSKKSKSVTLKYDITFLKSSEIRDLKQSLNKVVKANKERIEKEIN